MLELLISFFPILSWVGLCFSVLSSLSYWYGKIKEKNITVLINGVSTPVEETVMGAKKKLALASIQKTLKGGFAKNLRVEEKETFLGGSIIITYDAPEEKKPQ